MQAADGEDPVYLTFPSLTEIADPASPTTDPGWDLSIARTVLRLNGGVSGSGAGAAVTYPDGTAWADVTTAPTSGWAADAEPPSEWESGTALETWYDYDPTTHAVSASMRVHAVRGADGTPYKLQVTGWDDGIVSLRVAPLSEAE